MATKTGKGRCIVCEKERSAVRCEGCSQIFCFDHLTDHRRMLSKQFDEIEMNRDIFRQTLNEQANDPEKHFLIKQIDLWESNSIETIRQTAKECKQTILQQMNEHFQQIEINLTELTNRLKETRQENDFNETDLNDLKKKLEELEKQLDRIPNVAIEHTSTSFINKISVVRSSGNFVSLKGQLSIPHGIYVHDDEQCFYIADCDNHRIVRWQYGAKIGQVVAGGQGKGGRMDQLNEPTDVIMDKTSNSLIICDRGNRRVVRSPCRKGENEETIISDIDCYGATMDDRGDLYISDCMKHEVRRWKRGEGKGVTVAGGYGQGHQLNQLDYPTYLCVDEDHSVYVSSYGNHCVMKWREGAKEGVVVAGSQAQGSDLNQLDHPRGVTIDRLGNIYVADSANNRIMRWSKGSEETVIIVGGNGRGQQSNQFHYLRGLAFDRQGNLYVADPNNHRIQMFEIDLNSI